MGDPAVIDDWAMALRAAQGLQQRGLFKQAESAYRALLGVAPAAPQASHLLGLMARERGRPAEALEWIDRSIELSPNTAGFHRNRSAVLTESGRLREAENAARHAIELDPALAESFNNLGAALESQRRLDEAGRAYFWASQLKPDYAEPRKSLRRIAGGLQPIGGATQSEVGHRTTATSGPQHRIGAARFAIVTSSAVTDERLARLTVWNKWAYCRAHGYQLMHERIREPIPQAGDAGWPMTAALLKHIDRFEWLFWSDVASIITNLRIRLEDFLVDGADLIAVEDTFGVSTGQFLISNHGGRARPFLEAVQKQDQFTRHARREYAAINHVIRKGIAPLKVWALRPGTLFSTPERHAPGDFVSHFAERPARFFFARKHLWNGGLAPSPPRPPQKPGEAKSRKDGESSRNPDPKTMLALSQCLAAGNLETALTQTMSTLARWPADPQLMHVLGLIAHRSGRVDDAFDLMMQSIETGTSTAYFQNNLGALLWETGLCDESIRAFKESVRLDPSHQDGLRNLGSALSANADHDEAISALRRLTDVAPDSCEAYQLLGEALRKASRLDEAIGSFRKGLEFNACHGPSWHGLAVALTDAGRPNESITCYREMLDLPNGPNPIFHSDLLYTLHYEPSISRQQMLQEHLEFEVNHCKALAASHRRHSNTRDPDRRLRIGYVSPDFRRHPTSIFLEGLLEAHDHEQFEIVCYSDVRNPDSITERIASRVDGWRSTLKLSDEKLADLIREDGVDILVDQTGHCGNNRMLAYARKPAPVQVTFNGYVNTSGMSAIDYRLTDAWHDPPGDSEKHHTETLVRLPRCVWCYVPDERSPQVAPLPASANGFVTFGCLNKLAKVTPDVLRLWSSILKALPDARLLLSVAGGINVNPSVRAKLEEAAMPLDRVQVLDKTASRPEYLDRLSGIDIALDPFPFNGITTTCDSLWMGAAVVALAGDTFVSRSGVSLLTAVGISELIADTPEAYAKIALDLARDTPRLAHMRCTLRDRFSKSPLRDAAGQARAIENAYRKMWKRLCAGESAASWD